MKCLKQEVIIIPILSKLVSDISISLLNPLDYLLKAVDDFGIFKIAR